MTAFGKHELQTIIEDLGYLGSTWNPKVAESKLRRDSVILRRFFVDNEFRRAWNYLRIDEKPKVRAPRAEFFLEADTSNSIDFLVAGGGEFSKVQFAFALHQKRKTVLNLPYGVDLVEHSSSLEGFLNSLSIYLFGVSISRVELIKYISNKLGGAHLDSSRSGKLGEKFVALDENFKRLVMKDFHGQEQYLVYLELLSIGQLFLKSEAARIFCNTAKTF